MTSLLRFGRHWIGIFCVAGIVGCGSTEPGQSSVEQPDHGHDHESHGDSHASEEAVSFEDALAEVERLHGEIRDAFAAGEPKEADGAVHGIGHLLQDLPELAAEQSLAEADQQQVKEAVESLMDSFAAIDERIHVGEEAGKTYDEVATQIDAALAELKLLGKEE